MEVAAAIWKKKKGDESNITLGSNSPTVLIWPGARVPHQAAMGSPRLPARSLEIHVCYAGALAKKPIAGWCQKPLEDSVP